jgi:hypothetical protein
MCMAVYIASNVPLPLVAWNKDQPGFFVAELHPERESVRVQFSKPYVYYVGAHSGCGCGFAYGRNPEYEEDIEENRGSVTRLSQYLTKAAEQNETIELFACWEGDQAEEPVKRRKATPSDIGGESFWFEEREFLLIALSFD